MADSEIIVTLEANAGNKWDADKKTGAIGNYSPGTSRRSSWHMVFMPNGVEPGQKVRLLLHEIREDSAGKMMYRGTPASVEYTERWKENGDGTASRVTIATDWRLVETQEGVTETRKLATREVETTGRLDLKVVWGSDQASSFVERVEVKSFRQEAEKVQNGEIVWVGTGTREEQGAPERLPILQVKVWAGDFDRNKLELTYRDNWTLTADCYYSDSSQARENTEWGKLPVWIRQLTEARYPICGTCGKARYEKEQTSWCATCRPYREAEKLIADLITPTRKEELAGEAARFLGATAVLEGDSGIALLKATLDHIGESWKRDEIIRKWSGYGWYYFCDDGVYGSKFSPAALQILQFLPQATGNGLVEMVAWLVGGPKAGASDFYLRAQVNGEIGVTPSITADQATQLKVADFLRGSEADRIAALAGYHNLVSKLSEESHEAKAVAEILQSGKQDYAAALAKIGEAEEFLAAAHTRGSPSVGKGRGPTAERTVLAQAMRKAGLLK